MKHKKPLWIRAGITAGILLIMVSGIWLFFEWKIHEDAKTVYDDIAGLVAEASVLAETYKSVPLAVPVATDTGGSVINAPPTITTGSGMDLENAPSTASGQYTSRIDFEQLAKVNSDVIGWIRNEGTPIDYPITQGRDNSYYLEHLFTKSKNGAGCIFLDVHNAFDFSDQNSIIYGHHSRTKRMFASLTKYRDKAFFQEHPVMYLYTPSCDYLVEMIAGVVVDPYSSIAPFYHMTFADDETFLCYVQNIRRRSDFDADVEVVAGDRLLTLSTCTYETNDARYVVFGKMTPLPSFDGLVSD